MPVPGPSGHPQKPRMAAIRSRPSRAVSRPSIESGRTPGARFARVVPDRAEHARCIENEKAHLAVRCGLQAMPFAITKPDQIAFAHRRALIVRPCRPTAAEEINERLRALLGGSSTHITE